MSGSTRNPSLAAEAARLIVETGLEYGAAKRKAARAIGRRGGARTELPSNEEVESEVRDYIATFCAETQPRELAALREVAAQWMDRLADFRPHLSGAAWRGTATRQSAVHIDLYCDDPKAAQIALMNQGVPFDVSTEDVAGPDPVDVLTVSSRSAALEEHVTVHLFVRDFNDLRGALKTDPQGQGWRGNLAALRKLMQEEKA